MTELYEACGDEDIKRVELLLQNGADINAKYKYGSCTPLHVACLYKNTDLVELLLSYYTGYSTNADVNARDNGGSTPLHYACGFGYNKKIVELLIQNGADVNAINYSNRTPLHITCHLGYDELVALLIQNGANVNININAMNSRISTSLYLTCRYLYKNTIGLILDPFYNLYSSNGANHNNMSNTPLLFIFSI
jgi:ankyrin repeat protein